MTGSADAAPGYGPDSRAASDPATAGLPSAQRGVDTPSGDPALDPGGGADEDEPSPDDDGEEGRYVPL